MRAMTPKMLLALLSVVALLAAAAIMLMWPEAWGLLLLLAGNGPTVLEVVSFPSPHDVAAAAAAASAQANAVGGKLDVADYLARSNANWTFIGRSDGVDTFARKVRNSRLLTFRGVTVLDLHISDIMGPFVNVTQSVEWVAMLKHVERLPLVDPDTGAEDPLVDHIYQVLRLPWPITQRDILLRREFQFDRGGLNLTATPRRGGVRQITISYRSVQDDRVPEQSHLIRAHSPYTMWRFTMLDDDDSNHTDRSGESFPPQKIPSGFTHLVRAKLRRWRSQVKTWFGHVNSFISSKLRRSVQDPPFVRPEESSPTSTSSHPSMTSGTAEEQPVSYFSEKNGFCAVDPTQPVQRRKGRTIVEVETNVDSKGSIPIWFVNYMQRYWPAMTLSTFQRLAKAGVFDPDRRLLCW